MIYTVWFWNSYLVVALVMFLVVLLSAAANVMIRRHNQQVIASMTKYNTPVQVLRGGNWQEVNSTDVVAGDVIRVEKTKKTEVQTQAQDGEEDDETEGWVLPCEVLILRGNCVSDESGLTGESMPVQKSSIPSPAQGGDPFNKKHRLFAGTTLLDGASETSTKDADGDDGGGGGCVGLVTATGISTSKGELISQILFPTTMTFRYDEELPLVVGLLLVYGIICFALVCFFLNRQASKKSWVTMWGYGLFTMSQVVVTRYLGKLH